MRTMKLTLAALLIASAAFAQTQTQTSKTVTTTVTTTTKELPPVAGPAKPFTLPAVTKFDLPNGLAVRLVQYGSVPKTTVRLAIQTGNVDEGPNETWLADVTGDMLQQGTTSRTALRGRAFRSRRRRERDPRELHVVEARKLSLGAPGRTRREAHDLSHRSSGCSADDVVRRPPLDRVDESRLHVVSRHGRAPRR